MIATFLLLLLSPQAGTRSGSESTGVTSEVRFHRIHLRNGNFIDGELVRQSPAEVVLKLKSGEMVVRRHLIDRVEFVKMKGIQEKPQEVAVPAPRLVALPETGPTSSAASAKTPKTDRALAAARPLPAESFQPPAALKAKIDGLLDQVAKAGPEQIDPLVQELVSLDADAHKYLACLLEVAPRDLLPVLGTILSRTKTPAAAPYLARLVAHENPAVRLQAVVALGANGEAADAPALVPVLKDGAAEVRAAAVGSLATLGGKDAFDLLGRSAGDKDREVRARATSVLGQIAEQHDLRPELVAILGDHLEAAAPDAKADLLAAIGRTGLASSSATLARHLADASADVRVAAVTALSAVGNKESAGELVAQMAKEEDGRARSAMAAAAARLGAAEGIETLVAWMGDENADVRKASHAALKQLAKMDLGPEKETWEEWLETRKK